MKTFGNIKFTDTNGLMSLSCILIPPTWEEADIMCTSLSFFKANGTEIETWDNVEYISLLYLAIADEEVPEFAHPEWYDSYGVLSDNDYNEAKLFFLEHNIHPKAVYTLINDSKLIDTYIQSCVST